MSATAAVRYLVAGTVAEDVHTAERITHQQFADGRAHLVLYRDGQVAEHVAYRQAERIRIVVEHLEQA